jgi:tRNA-uridine 2-sulfurtransferase
MTRCVVLLSGGLDSMLAIRIMQEQGIEVEALNFKTMFTCCQDTSAQAARALNVPITVVGHEEDYLDLIREPQFGYGKGANPCVDCRIYMFQRAHKFMETIDAQFIVSGEVVGQRPMSQKRSDLKVISNYSGLEDLLLRPLSAKVLEPTKPERDGIVDREKLYDFQGRSRKGLIALAREFGFTEDMIPTPSTGCALTEPGFGSKVHDLIQIQVNDTSWDYEILKLGRHFRWDEETKVVVGRDEQENDRLEYIHAMPQATSTAILEPASFTGPSALITGPATSEAIQYAVGLVCRYGGSVDGAENRVQVSTADNTNVVVATDNRRAAEDQTIASMLIR